MDDADDDVISEHMEKLCTINRTSLQKMQVRLLYASL